MVSASQLPGRGRREHTRAGPERPGTHPRIAGRHEEAERIARDAVGNAEETDDLNMRGDTLPDLGRVLSEAGERDDAVFAVEQALGLYDAKGNSAAVAGARRWLGELGA